MSHGQSGEPEGAQFDLLGKSSTKKMTIMNFKTCIDTKKKE